MPKQIQFREELATVIFSDLQNPVKVLELEARFSTQQIKLYEEVKKWAEENKAKNDCKCKIQPCPIHCTSKHAYFIRVGNNQSFQALTHLLDTKINKLKE